MLRIYSLAALAPLIALALPPLPALPSLRRPRRPTTSPASIPPISHQVTEPPGGTDGPYPQIFIESDGPAAVYVIQRGTP